MAVTVEAGNGSYRPLGGSPGRPNGSLLRQQIARWMPMTVWLPKYQWRETFPKDFAGALTLGLILTAQSLAHADLCGVSVIHGTYSCMLPPLVYAVFGTCVHGSVGTGSLISLLTGVRLQSYGDLAQRTHAVGIFSFEVGAVLSLMGFLRLAFMVRFLSRPALSGFITATVFITLKSCVRTIVGLPPVVGREAFRSELQRLGSANPATVALSAFTMAVLLGSKRLGRLHWSLKLLSEFKEIFALFIGAVFCTYYAEEFGVEVVGKVPSGLPTIQLPFTAVSDLDLAKEMLPSATLVALVTYLASFAGAKKFSVLEGYTVDATNELMALGFGNLASGLCGGVPVRVGLSRMGIARAIGVKTLLGSNVLVGSLVTLVVWLWSADLFSVPRCALSCVIVYGVSQLTEFNEAKALFKLHTTWRQRTDLAVWIVAFLSTLFLGAFEGIIVAVAVSLVLVLYQVAQPPIRVLGEVDTTNRWLATGQPGVQQRPGVLAFRVEGPIFYANAEIVQDYLEQLEMDETAQGNNLHTIICSCSAVAFIDSTAVQVLKAMLQSHTDRGIAFYFANSFGKAEELLERALRPTGLLRQKSLQLSVLECLNLQDAQERQLATRSGSFTGSERRLPRSLVQASVYQCSPTAQDSPRGVSARFFSSDTMERDAEDMPFVSHFIRKNSMGTPRRL